MHRIAVLMPVCLALAACVTEPEVYAPPAQRKPFAEILTRSQPLLDMSDPAVEQHFVQDIARGPQATPWRWTGKRPTVRIALRSTANYRYHMEFAVADPTFKDTGPVTITYFVNDTPIESVRYDSPGKKTYDKPIPMHLLKPMADNVLAAEIDKTWSGGKNGPPLGIILVNIGLVQ